MQTKDLSLYQFQSCPFCARVRNVIARLGLEIEIRDIEKHTEHHSALVQATGRQTVPCLRIDDGAGKARWMHESADIIAYLEQRFA